MDKIIMSAQCRWFLLGLLFLSLTACGGGGGGAGTSGGSSTDTASIQFTFPARAASSSVLASGSLSSSTTADVSGATTNAIEGVPDEIDIIVIDLLSADEVLIESLELSPGDTATFTVEAGVEYIIKVRAYHVVTVENDGGPVLVRELLYEGTQDVPALLPGSQTTVTVSMEGVVITALIYSSSKAEASFGGEFPNVALPETRVSSTAEVGSAALVYPDDVADYCGWSEVLVRFEMHGLTTSPDILWSINGAPAGDGEEAGEFGRIIEGEDYVWENEADPIEGYGCYAPPSNLPNEPVVTIRAEPEGMPSLYKERSLELTYNFVNEPYAYDDLFYEYWDQSVNGVCVVSDNLLENDETDFSGFSISSEPELDYGPFHADPNNPVVISLDGNFVYTSVPGFIGEDYFVYRNTVTKVTEGGVEIVESEALVTIVCYPDEG